MNKTRWILSAALLLAGVALPGRAAILLNGDFESGGIVWYHDNHNITWIEFGGECHTGLQCAFLTNLEVPGSGAMGQPFVVPADGEYEVSFWLRNYDTTGNNVLRLKLFSLPSPSLVLDNLPQTDWTRYSFIVSLSAGNNGIEFQGRNNGSFFYIDDVSIEAAGPTSGVPEPSAGVLMLTGAALAIWRRAAAGQRKTMPMRPMTRTSPAPNACSRASVRMPQRGLNQ